MDKKELQALRIEIAKSIYVAHTVGEEISIFSQPNFEDNLPPARIAFRYADYFIAASLEESRSFKALQRRINAKFGSHDTN